MSTLGHTLRARRNALGLTLAALATRAGVSRAMLSDIERDVKNPTIKVLTQIAAGLECTIAYLLGEQPEKVVANVQVIRKNERRMLIDPQSGVERQLIAPALLQHGIEVVWYVIPPTQQTGAFPPHHKGVAEHITVIQGSLHCVLGEQHIVLASGDSLFFPADVTHDFSNHGPDVCAYFLIIDSSHQERDLR